MWSQANYTWQIILRIVFNYALHVRKRETGNIKEATLRSFLSFCSTSYHLFCLRFSNLVMNSEERNVLEKYHIEYKKYIKTGRDIWNLNILNWISKLYKMNDAMQWFHVMPDPLIKHGICHSIEFRFYYFKRYEINKFKFSVHFQTI